MLHGQFQLVHSMGMELQESMNEKGLEIMKTPSFSKKKAEYFHLQSELNQEKNGKIEENSINYIYTIYIYI